MIKNFSFTAIALFCLVFLMAIPAMAQEETGQKVSDAELEKAAKAYVEIARIQNEFQQSVQVARDQNERQKLQQKANETMVEAVEGEDLEAQRFNEIMELIREDQKLMAKFTTTLQSLE